MGNIEIHRNRINIMTSCDDNLTDYIFVQLRTIVMHLRGKDVHFYILHTRIPDEKLEKLRVYCECLGNIKLHKIFVEDVDFYLEFAKNGMWNKITKNSNGRWPYEAYFPIACHKYLPIDVDRVLYIDAGDILFMGDIDEFYFDDFDGKSLIVMPRLFRDENGYFHKDDLKDFERLKAIKYGIFNSGSYMIDVDKLRKDDVTFEEVMLLIDKLPKESENDVKYFTDQGLLSILFIDDMKFYNYPQENDLGYQPYNFSLSISISLQEREKNGGRGLWYEPKIVHIAAVSVKPWKLISVLLREGVLEEGQKISIEKVLQIALKFKQSDLKHTNIPEPERTIIEEGMLPFYEYWFEINNLVQIELSEIFD